MVTFIIKSMENVIFDISKRASSKIYFKANYLQIFKSDWWRSLMDVDIYVVKKIPATIKGCVCLFVSQSCPVTSVGQTKPFNSDTALFI